jgi:hypothetical protein
VKQSAGNTFCDTNRSGQVGDGNDQNIISATHPAVDPVRERKKPLAKRRAKAFFCTVVSEQVEISLKRQFSLGPKKGELFVQCNQFECQYVDHNTPPCPLSLALFAAEIEKREEKHRNGQMEF